MIQNIFSWLPFFVCLFWLILFIIQYKHVDPAKKFFTYFLLVCTLLYFSHALYFHRYIYYYSLIESFYTFCSLAVYPLYYLYICKLTSIKQFSLKSYWVLLPALIIGVLSVIFYGMMNEAERISFVEYHFFQKTDGSIFSSFAEQAQEIRISVTKILFILQLLPVAFYGYQKLSQFNRSVSNYYADTENRTMAPVQKLLLVFILFAIFSGTANLLGREFFIRESWLLVIPSLIFGSMLFLVSYIAYTQQFTATDFCKDAADNICRDETEAETTSNQDSIILSRRLKQLMEEEQLFRQKDLHITDIAIHLGSNRTYVSNYINQELGLSFSDYINQYRIGYAQNMMTDSASAFSMLEISEQSGFANEVSFYRNFKKITGTTPNRWLRQQALK
jgi:AraC-like DNA-binding protein